MTSTRLFGHVGEFIAEHEMFNAYVERMDIFFWQIISLRQQERVTLNLKAIESFRSEFTMNL